MDITTTPEWAALEDHAREFEGLVLRDLLTGEPDRIERLTLSVGDLVIDASKNRVSEITVSLLSGLADRVGLAERIQAMLRGEPMNSTERRAALHTALRAPAGTVVEVDGNDVVADVHRVLARMGSFADRVRDGDWRGHTGQPIETVVNIGIGGSDLGPVMAYEALAANRHERIRCRFVSNIDGSDLAGALDGLDPASTLFIVSSKSFTTAETITNARSARHWLVDHLGEESVAAHFVAVSTNGDEVAAFGIDTDNMFEFWDWVGGRYSVDSAIGLSLMLAVGPAAFDDMLAGFRIVDEHFASAPFERNGPALLGLIAVWYRTFCRLPTRAVLPYARHLHRFPAYLQQLDMESNGKRVRLDGTELDYPTGPIVWGEPGTNGQHSFHQLLHQGTTIVPADFVVFARPGHDAAMIAAIEDHHSQLVANCFAQAEALAFGRSADEVAAAGVDPALIPHRTFPGNRPSTTILAPALTPSVLGQLVAFYEHQVFTQGVVWGINSFDQWGVELGKDLATAMVPELTIEAEPTLEHDPSTNALIRRYRSLRGSPGGEV